MPQKTYKREVAMLMLAPLGASHLWGVWDEMIQSFDPDHFTAMDDL